MIFVTVGTQLGFDRLVQAVDAWAKDNPHTEVFVQRGIGQYNPQFCASEEFTAPPRWEELFQHAEKVVSHAGMGTILKSIDQAKPLIVMPRQAALGEHRNDHQCATARRFSDVRTIRVVNEAAELAHALNTFCAEGAFHHVRSPQFDSLLQTIRQFIAVPR